MLQNYDLVIFDPHGVAYTSTTHRHGGLGGSEFEVVLLAEALAQKGVKIAVLNAFKFPTVEYGVHYWPHDILRLHTVKCKTLLMLRSFDVPYTRIEYDNVRFWITDIPDQNTVNQMSPWAMPGRPGNVVCVSNWQRSMLPPMWNTTTIHNMIPDWVYDLGPKAKVPGKNIYASAALKGLEPTIEFWKELKKNYFMKKSELFVCHPGYDAIDVEKLKANKINFMGSLSFPQLVEEMRTSEKMFMVSSLPETFGISPVLAEVLGVVPQIMFMQHPGALTEVLANSDRVTGNADLFQKQVFDNAKELPVLKPANDYRVSKILPKWQKELKL